MLCLHYFNALLLFLLWSNIDAHLPSPFDVRIDHYKVDTIRDLVINTPRPRVSWKIPPSKSRLHRNVQQIAYQIQLQSVKLSQVNESYHHNLFMFPAQTIWIFYHQHIIIFVYECGQQIQMKRVNGLIGLHSEHLYLIYMNI